MKNYINGIHLRVLVIMGMMFILVQPLSEIFAIDFPADSGVIDMSTYGILPDDGIDDTAAIQSVLDANPGGNKIFYFQNGTYNVSNTMTFALSSGVAKRNIIQGESETGTVFKLTDNSGLASAVFDYRTGTAQSFRNAVRDVTIDIGSGNAGASGLKFNASNQGLIENVTIRSADGQGAVGLDMKHSSEIGPLYVHNITVQGFDVGIYTAWQTASQTFDGVNLQNQNQKGWVNESSQSVWARNVQSQNSVTAIWNAPNTLPGDGQGRFLLVDSSLQGTGAAASVGAIQNQRYFYANDVQTSGYGLALNNAITSFRGNGSLSSGNIDEYWASGAYNGGQIQGGPYELFRSPDRGLNLTTKDTPTAALPPPNTWASPLSYGGIPNDGIDDTAAIQAAIDSGSSVVYLPNGTWDITGEVQLRGNVQRFMGTEAKVKGGGTVRVVDGTAPFVIIERLEGGLAGEGIINYVQDTSRQLVLQEVMNFHYRADAAAPGDLFLNDVTSDTMTFHNQKVWARQLNLEGSIEGVPGIEAKVLNDGGEVWILGMKTEGDGTHIKTVNGGKTELLGALQVGSATTATRYITIDSQFSAAMVKGGTSNVSETRDGVTLTGNIGAADLYTAFRFSDVPEIYVDNADAGKVFTVGAWSALQPPPGGFLESNLLRETTHDGLSKSITFKPDFTQAGVYGVYMRWMNDISDPINHATNVPVDFSSSFDFSTVSVNEKLDGGKWNLLGQFSFAADGNDFVRIRTDGANGYVFGDGFKFVLIQPIPEPKSGALLLASLVLMGFVICRPDFYRFFRR